MSTPRPRALGIAVAAVLAGVLGRGLWIASYEPATSDAYLWGAFHVHSTFSDGLRSIESIAREAKEARVSFVMLSDHGAPHPEAATFSRKLEGVRFIGGSEVGLPDGHLIVSDVEEVPRYTLPPFPPDAVADAARWGGIAVVTYPEDPVHAWKYWDDDFVPHGIEIVNVTSYFREASLLRKLDWGVFSLFNRRYFVSGFEAPAYALERWDALLERGRVVAFYASNAHGGFPLSEETTIGVPSYRTALSYVGLGVERRYESSPEEAIRRGDFFSLVRAAGEPRRFDFGEDDGAIRVNLEAAAGAARIDLKRNGKIVASTETGSLLHPITEPGVFRAEVYLLDHPLLGKEVPWILSNAIFAGVEPVPVAPRTLSCDTVDPVTLDELGLEKDGDSSGAVEILDSGALRLSYHLSQSTPANVDRWVALALRKPMDLSSYRGILFAGASPETMRYWVEIRAGDDGHYASVQTGPEGEAVAIPWDRFYPTVGDERGISLARIDALFVTVNTSSSTTGFSAEVSIEKLGFCR